MGCACKVPIEDYPENAEWGPLFWKILHGLAQLAGKQTNDNLQNDERRNWIHLLTQLQFTLPCDICRNHYSIWITDHPIDGLNTMPYSGLGLWIQTNLWELHNVINQGNNRPTFLFADLITYNGVNITDTWKALTPIMKKAIRLNGISLLPWNKWLSYVRMLQGIY